MGCINSGHERIISPKHVQEDSKDVEDESTVPVCITIRQKEHNLVTDIPNFWSQFELKHNIGTGLLDKQICTVLNRMSNRGYVVKVLKNQKAFMNEVQLVCSMQCPYILRFMEAYRDPKAYYIVYEFCIGEHLIKRIVNKKKYNEYLASKTVYMMLHAVKYLHEKNIIHRDIGPDAFFYQTENDSRLKLFDFGLAMKIEPEKKYQDRAGTPYFMAPEVVLNTEPRTGELSKKADLWSLGVSVFLMLNGEYPFVGTKRDEIFESILNNQIKFRKTISEDARDFVTKLLTRDPKLRMSADDALEHNWIQNSGKRDLEILESAVEGLRVFHAKDSIERALERIATETMDAHDENHYKELFSRFDQDGDGSITRIECIRALQMDSLYKDRAEEIADDLMAKSGDNHNLIHYQNFRDSMIMRDLTSDEYRMDAVFSALDTNSDGHISIQELIRSIPHSDSKEVQRCIERFQKADADGDDQLSFAEFTKIFDNKTQEQLHLKEFGGATHCKVNDREKYCGHGNYKS